MNKFKKIVITSLYYTDNKKYMNILKSELERNGVNVLLINKDISFNDSYETQKSIILSQIRKETEAEFIAADMDNTVIICNGGLIDAKAYLSDDEFDELKKVLNISDIRMRDYYDAAFHIESKSYVDYEIQLNKKILKVWCGNPHYRFIPYNNNSDTMTETLLKEVRAYIGIPEPLEIEKKYLIKRPDINFLLSKNCNKVEITQYYLYDNDIRFRVRSRGIGDDCVYTKTIKTKITDTVYEEIEDTISKDEFDNYISSYNLWGHIFKERYCLMENGMYYEIDIFPFWSYQAFLEIELIDENQSFTLPEYIDIIEDVTRKSEYKNINLCKCILNEKN